MSAITATVRVDDGPAAGAVVLLCTADGRGALGGGEAGPDGSVRIELPADSAGTGLLATLRGATLAGGWWPLDQLEDDPTLALHGPFHRLAVAVSGAGPPPAGAQAWVEPIAFAGVPDALAPLLGYRSPTVIDFRFASQPMPSGRAEFRVAAGRYAIGAGVPVADGPQPRGAPPRGWVAARASAAGAELTREGADGFRIDVGEDTDVTVELREIELS